MVGRYRILNIVSTVEFGLCACATARVYTKRTMNYDDRGEHQVLSTKYQVPSTKY